MNVIIDFLIVALITGTLIATLIPVARSVNLVDHPDERKLHNGSIPLIGGIAMFIVFAITALSPLSSVEQSSYLLTAIAIIVFTGAYDDYKDISFKSRLFIQAFSALIVVYLCDVKLLSLGDLFGAGDIELGIFSIPLTVIGIVGVINAVNMIDGMDGLAATLSLVSFLAVGILLDNGGYGTAAMGNYLFAFLIIPFLLFNLGFFGSQCKVFLGDAGSMFLGFMLAYSFINYSQGPEPVFPPVTALWIFALPLMDTVSVMFRRIKKGQSPFKPDRQHLHHIFQRAGYSDRMTLLLITSLSVAFAGIGIVGHIYQASEWFMFFAFMATFFIYNDLFRHAWKFMRSIKLSDR